MKQEWIDNCLRLMSQEAVFYSGSRKILKNVILEFNWPCTLTYGDVGYSDNMKKRQLERNYLDQESLDMASALWDSYRARPKYRSVTFSTVRSLLKDAKGPRGSKMGPCVLGGILSMDNKGKEVEITLCYRTSEYFKKFPADLVFFSDLIQKNFNLEGMTVTKFQCFFTNLTIHPAYAVILLPHLKDPIKHLEKMKSEDKYFFDWTVKWSSRYLIEKYGHGIQKFAQALQVKKYAVSRITGNKLQLIQEYLEMNHPGYRSSRYPNDESIETDEDN